MREITPLTSSDCFTMFSRVKAVFDFPLHCHEELELNFILHAAGARRIIGDHIEEIGDMELVLVGSNLPHVWQTHKCKNDSIEEITIQFHKDLLDEKFLRRNQMSHLRKMLELSAKGISFSEDTIRKLMPRLQTLNQKSAFPSILELMSILHELSVSRNMRTLSDTVFSGASLSYNSRRVEKVIDYLNQHFHENIALSEISELVNMTPVSFSRFFKQRTGISFIDNLLEIRLGHASRQLIDTTNSISEIAYNCGFNNISNFNRLFKKKKNCTPREFRENYNYDNRIFV
ncbi:MAG TPA: AraC family transcriptional regulator [Phnomibacter sp.]|nr:AraC family transcriptional regulator [Phnomibacter sp.]